MFFAAYDPAHSSSAGDYWAWRHPDLPKRLLDSFYYEVFAKNLPRDPAKIGLNDCVGGYAQIQGEWGCWYRFFNGGRDQFNRLGRFVIGCAFVRLEESRKGNLSGILQATQFNELSAIASASPPLPAPGKLDFEFNPIPIASPPSRLSAFLGGEVIEYQGDDANRLVGDLVAFIPPDVACHCDVLRMDGATSIACSRNAGKPPPFLPVATPNPSLLPTRPTISPSNTNGWPFEILRRRVSVPIWLLVFLLLLLLLTAWQSLWRSRSSRSDELFPLIRRDIDTNAEPNR